MANSIARYLLNEASSGTTPTIAADDQGSNDLSVNYGNSVGNWTSNAQGSGFESTDVAGSSNGPVLSLMDIATNGNIGASLSGATQASMIVVVDLDAGFGNLPRILSTSQTLTKEFFSLTHDVDVLNVYWNGPGTRATYPSLVGLGPVVVTVVVDTTLATDSDRIKVWYDGVLQTATASDYPIQNFAIDTIGTDSELTLFNRSNQNRPIDGRIFYAELFTGVLTPTEVSDATTALQSSNDSNWDTPDVIAPTLQSATIGTSGDTLTLVFDEPVVAGAGGEIGFDDLSTGELLTYSSGDGTDTIVYSISPPVSSLASPTLEYNNPGDGWQDTSANEVASFTGFTVTNNSTVSFSITTYPASLRDGGTGYVLTASGGGFEASQGGGSVTLGGEALTVTSWADDSITISVPLSLALKYSSGGYTLTVTNNSAQSSSVLNVPFLPDENWQYVVFNGIAPDAGTTESFYEYAQTDANVGNLLMAAGDQLAWLINAGLSIDAQTIPTIDPPQTVNGSYKIWDESAGNWSSTSTFLIDDLGIVDLAAPVITLTGDDPLLWAHGAAFTDPGYSANDNVDGDITNNVVVTGSVNVNASGVYTLSYDVDDAAGNSATTQTRDVHVQPEFPVVIDSVVPSKTSCIVNFSYAGTDVTGFEYNIGGGWLSTTSPLTLTGLTEDTAYSIDIRPVNGIVLGNATNDSFQTLPDSDVTPNAFSFTAQTDVARSVFATSNAITVQGVDAGQDIPVVVTNGEYSVSTDGGNNWGAWTSTGTNVRLNYQVRVRHTTAATYNTAQTTDLDIGGVVGQFVSTTLADTVPPVITLTGGNVSIVQYDTWSELGYSAIDNADGDITIGGVVVTGSVNTNVPGDYVLTYTATDSAGNQAVSTRTVTVTPFVPADTAPPVISLIGGNVSIDEGDPWVDPGYSAVDAVDGVVPVVVSGAVNTSVPGNYSITYTATDDAGNSSSVSRTVTVVPAIQYPFDSAAPASRTYIASRASRIERGEALFFKQPEEILDYDFDLTDWLTEQGDSLDDDVISVDVNGARSHGVERIPGTNRVKVWLGEGEHNTSYAIELTIRTVGARTAQFILRLAVVDRG